MTDVKQVHDIYLINCTKARKWKLANHNQTNRQAKNSLIFVSVKKALKYEREKCEFSGFIDKAMPSNQFYTPFMVDKGIQCVLLRSPVNSFESTSRRDLTCVNSTELGIIIIRI